MRCAFVGSRYFGATVFRALCSEAEVEITSVVAPSLDDRLAMAAQEAGYPLHLLENPRFVPGEAIAEGTDLILAAHTHARVSDEALARSRLGGIGYHPSLLPRHRGIAAVEWTILQGDPIAGGSVYHLADGWDAGAIAAQDWCFVEKGETARELWERALAPMGLELLVRVVRYTKLHGELPSHPQDERFASKAPMIRRAVVLSEDSPATNTSVIITLMGPDRPGIVNQLADRAQRFAANWSASRMSKLAGEFAGMVHFELPRQNVEPFTEALRELESSGLRVVIASSEGGGVPDGMREYQLELVGDDRVGIVNQLTRTLAERGVSIEHIHTETVDAATGRQSFKVVAHLLVPRNVSIDLMRQELGVLANEMMVDIALGDRTAKTAVARTEFLAASVD